MATHPSPHRGWGVIAFGLYLLGWSVALGGIALGSIMLFVALAHAADATLAWTASPSPGVTGYRVHQGTVTGTYTTTKDAGLVTTTVITDLTPGQRYFFAATAYDAFGQQSGFSNEGTYLVPLPSPPAAPINLRVVPLP